MTNCKAVPADCFREVLRDTLAVLIHDPEVCLRPSPTLIGSQPEQADGFGGILVSTFPPSPHDSKIELCCTVSLIGGHLVPMRRFSVVLVNTHAATILES